MSAKSSNITGASSEAEFLHEIEEKLDVSAWELYDYFMIVDNATETNNAITLPSLSFLRDVVKVENFLG